MNLNILFTMRLTLFICITLSFTATVFAEENPGWLTSPHPTPAEVTAWASRPSARTGGAPSFANRLGNTGQVTPLAGAISLGKATATQAAQQQPGQIAALVSVGNEADEITPAISELARGLRNDPLKIFQYVHNYIDFEPYYGSKKGAHLTLLEGSGNDFDQCALLVSLLRAAGLNPSYKYGPCIFSFNELVGWMGLSAAPYEHWTDAQFASQYGISDTSAGNIARHRRVQAVSEFLIPRGYFYVDALPGGGYFSISHVWVEITVAGTVQKLSPAFKSYVETPGIDLAATMGYTRGGLYADIGGTTGTPDYAAGLNYGNLSNHLKTYTQSLLTYLRSNAHEMSVDEVVGSRKIDTVVFDSFAQVPIILPDDFIASDWLEIVSWDAIPELYMSKLKIIAGVYNYTNKTWAGPKLFEQVVNMPALKGRKLSLSFNGNTGRIHLDETILGPAFSIPAGSTVVDIGLEAAHNHYQLTYDAGTETYVETNQGKSTQREIKPYLTNNSFAYALIYSFGNPDKLRREREEVLDGYRRAGLSESDWKVKTEILNIMGLNWLYQSWQQRRIIGPQFNTLGFSHHRFGRVAQEQSYYIDVGLQLSAPANRSQNSTLEDQFFYLTNVFASAMEHGVMEQLQGEGKSAASTVKMIYRANQLGQRIYRASGGAFANWTAVKAQLTNYPDSVKDEIENAIVGTEAMALLPRDGNIVLNSWRGRGYAIESPDKVSMKISGNLFGGYMSAPAVATAKPLADQYWSDPAYTATATSPLSLASIPLTTPQMASNEPIDMASGAYFLDKTEMQVGGQAAPRGLVFSRHYNSNRAYDKSVGLGYGWTHNYDIRVTKRTSVKAGLGETISYHAAPFLASMLVASDIYKSRTNAADWVIAALVTHWGTEQLKYNAVSVTMGNKTIEFIKMPDGTYVAPAGMNLTLTLNAQVFKLTERNGPTMTFMSVISTINPGVLTTITDLYGKTQSFAYSGTKLTSVTDAWGRKLTFTWSGDEIASVSDSSSAPRLVSFVYTGGDLTTCIDVEGKGWTYVYDGNHRMTLLRDPSNRIIAENIYDTKGRVKQQNNMGDAAKAWNYYYSGYCTIEEDPLGALTRYYYDSRARSLGVGDALNFTDEIAYDGQDRRKYHVTRKGEWTYFFYDKENNLTWTLDPDYNWTEFTYDTMSRLTALKDKRGNTTTYNYNSKNQVDKVFDPLGNKVENFYDATTGNIREVKDADGNSTDYTYDSYGQVKTIRRGGVLQLTLITDKRGDVNEEHSANGNATGFIYDKRRQLLVSTEMPMIIRSYNDEGALASLTDLRGNVTSYSYSASGKLLTTTLPALPAGNNVLTNTYGHL